MRLPAFLLPVLFLLGFLGGWYLIPADVAWLLVEFADRRGRDGLRQARRFVAKSSRARRGRTHSRRRSIHDSVDVTAAPAGSTASIEP